MIDLLRQSFERLRSTFRSPQLDSDLEAELASHLELAIEENIQHGMPVSEARRQAGENEARRQASDSEAHSQAAANEARHRAEDGRS